MKYILAIIAAASLAAFGATPIQDLKLYGAANANTNRITNATDFVTASGVSLTNLAASPTGGAITGNQHNAILGGLTVSNGLTVGGAINADGHIEVAASKHLRFQDGNGTNRIELNGVDGSLIVSGAFAIVTTRTNPATINGAAIATGTPVYVESDPVWVAASNAYAIAIAAKLATNGVRAGGLGGVLITNAGGFVYISATNAGGGGSVTNGQWLPDVYAVGVTATSAESSASARLASNVWATAASTTNYVARTGGSFVASDWSFQSTGGNTMQADSTGITLLDASGGGTLLSVGAVNDGKIEAFLGVFAGDGSGLTGLNGAAITNLTTTTDTNALLKTGGTMSGALTSTVVVVASDGPQLVINNSASNRYGSMSIDQEGAMDLAKNAYRTNRTWRSFDTNKVSAIIESDSANDLLYYTRPAAATGNWDFVRDGAKFKFEDGTSTLLLATNANLIGDSSMRGGLQVRKASGYALTAEVGTNLAASIGINSDGSGYFYGYSNNINRVIISPGGTYDSAITGTRLCIGGPAPAANSASNYQLRIEGSFASRNSAVVVLTNTTHTYTWTYPMPSTSYVCFISYASAGAHTLQPDWSAPATNSVQLGGDSNSAVSVMAVGR